MANGLVTLPANTWTQIASSGLTAVSWQNRGPRPIYVAATSANSAPTGDFEDWPLYAQGIGEAGIDATALFSGVASAAYLWAYAPGEDGLVWRSHA